MIEGGQAGPIWFFNPSTKTWVRTEARPLDIIPLAYLIRQISFLSPSVAGTGFMISALRILRRRISRFRRPPRRLFGAPFRLQRQSPDPGLAWDPIANVVVAYPNGGNVLYTLDPRTWTCTSQTFEQPKESTIRRTHRYLAAKVVHSALPVRSSKRHLCSLQ